MKRGNSRGLSPVIASVLLIMLVIVLAAIIFLWARGFIDEQIEKFAGGENQNIDNVCEDVNFDFDMFKDTVGAALEVEIVNRGDIPIHHFDIKAIKGGDSEVQQFSFSVGPGEAKRAGITFLQFEGDPEKIIIYPVLLGNVKGKKTNKPYTCNTKGITKYLDDIKTSDLG